MQILRLLMVILVLCASVASADDASYEKRIEEALAVSSDASSQESSGELLGLATEIQASINANESADLYALLGRVYFYLEDDPKAESALQRALDLDPRSATANRFLGLLYLYGGRLADAQRVLRVASEIQPDDARIHLELGDVLARSQKLEEAIVSFDKALELAPENPEIMRRLAPLLASSGELQRAVVYYAALTESEKENPDLFYNLGQTYQSLGQHESAVHAFERVLELDADDWRAKEKAVQENQALGRTEERDAFRKSLFRQRADSPGSELGKAQFYCREQFAVEQWKIYAFEYFDLLGDRPRVYEFRVVDQASQEEALVISLGSYDLTNSIFRETGKIAVDERAFHLDTYSPDGLEHKTYGFFLARPTYEATRSMVLQVLAGDLKPVSGTTVQNEGE